MTYVHTQPWALYNEIDEYAASWLENLIAAGLIANGIVDRRSIEDILPDDLRGFRQVHLFAGIGVWSYALRRAGVSDDVAVWTASCPCQPFSSAGKGSGMADERHLWPAAYHLIRECRPSKIYGEQVASPDGLNWFDLVSNDLEVSNYAIGAVDTSSALTGAPHIRQRLRFHAYDLRSAASGLALTESFGSGTGLCDSQSRGNGWDIDCDGGPINRVDHHNHTGLEGFGSRYRAEIGQRQRSLRSASPAGEPSGMADDEHDGRWEHGKLLGETTRGSQSTLGERERFWSNSADDSSAVRTGPTNGFWRDADWLFCRDGKWRPVEPGTFPLAHGAPSRVGRLRAYGNAVDAEATRYFIEATLERETLDIAVSEPDEPAFEELM